MEKSKKSKIFTEEIKRNIEVSLDKWLDSNTSVIDEIKHIISMVKRNQLYKEEILTDKQWKNKELLIVGLLFVWFGLYFLIFKLNNEDKNSEKQERRSYLEFLYIFRTIFFPCATYYLIYKRNNDNYTLDRLTTITKNNSDSFNHEKKLPFKQRITSYYSNDQQTIQNYIRVLYNDILIITEYVLLSRKIDSALIYNLLSANLNYLNAIKIVILELYKFQNLNNEVLIGENFFLDKKTKELLKNIEIAVDTKVTDLTDKVVYKLLLTESFTYIKSSIIDALEKKEHTVSQKGYTVFQVGEQRSTQLH
jgi:hypothetical protein